MFSPHNRILWLIGGLSVAASLTILVVFAATDSERGAIQTESERSVQHQSVGDDLSTALGDERQSVADFVLASDPASQAQYEQAVRDEAAAIAQIRAGVPADSPIAKALDKVAAASLAWRVGYGDPAVAAVRNGIDVEADAAGRATVHTHDIVQSASAELIAALDAVDRHLDDRTGALNGARTLATGLGVGFELFAAAISLWFVRRYGRKLEQDAAEASVLNRFTEVATFAVDDETVAASNLEALQLLVNPDAAVTHILNRSKDRAVAEAHFGDVVPSVLPLHTLTSCPGIVRGSVYVTDDASARLSVRCPVYPSDHGTVACVPLAHGENVGAVHLFWNLPMAFPLEQRAAVARIAEHAALAIGNRRLMAALHGQANTDARTGLYNSRAFDRALEEALGEMDQGESVGVLMLDLDHFKDVNDRHGHPAGDEALRSFSSVLRSCMRDGDFAARYGGEEFAVILPGVDEATGLAVAERIRSRTESTLISLAPGVTERLTVSIGMAMAPAQSTERVALLRIADEALYEAKQSGRNRVSFLGAASTDVIGGSPSIEGSPQTLTSEPISA